MGRAGWFVPAGLVPVQSDQICAIAYRPHPSDISFQAKHVKLIQWTCSLGHDVFFKLCVSWVTERKREKETCCWQPFTLGKPYQENLLMKRKKGRLPKKNCRTCGLEFTWRKKWRNNWENVKYCSKRCSKN